MTTSAAILAIDLGTSRVKVSVVNQNLHILGDASATYPTLSTETGMAEQRCEEWLAAMRQSTEAALAAWGSGHVDAIVLTGQMPTLVALSSSGDVLGAAVTWQDSRADALVERFLRPDQARRLYELSGTPIDGRYVIPMHLRRTHDASYEPALLLSAKDFVFFALTGVAATDPSTASGFANYDLESRDWSAELNELWNLDPALLPEVVDARFTAPLSAAGAGLLTGVSLGTPVVVGAADSVCAHHFVTSIFGDAVSIIDGSSTVILSSIPRRDPRFDHLLITPLVDGSHIGVEMDLLASGSSILWLAGVLGLSAAELEELAVTNARSSTNEVLVFPYLAGGEQGALWRTDLTGSITGLNLSSGRVDLATSLFEAIAFETVRCLELLRDAERPQRIVSLCGSQSRLFGAALIGALSDQPVVAVRGQSPPLLGAALVALAGFGVTGAPELDDHAVDAPPLNPDYAESLPAKLARYLAASPAPGFRA